MADTSSEMNYVKCDISTDFIYNNISDNNNINNIFYASLYFVWQCVAETAAAQIVETRSRRRNSKLLMNLIRIPHRRKHSGLRRIMKNIRWHVFASSRDR